MKTTKYWQVKFIQIQLMIFLTQKYYEMRMLHSSLLLKYTFSCIPGKYWNIILEPMKSSHSFVSKWFIYKAHIYTLYELCRPWFFLPNRLLLSYTEMFPEISVILQDVVNQNKNLPYEIAFLKHLLPRKFVWSLWWWMNFWQVIAIQIRCRQI